MILKERKRNGGDPTNEPTTKTMRQGPQPSYREGLDQGLWLHNEGTSNSWRYEGSGTLKEERIIEITDSDSDATTKEDDDFKNEDNDDSDDDDSLDINDFDIKKKIDPTSSSRSRALCEWDLLDIGRNFEYGGRRWIVSLCIWVFVTAICSNTCLACA